jgi:hypothetical protein
VETIETPIYATTQETLPGLLGLLPVTREVTHLVGYDVETVTARTDLPVDVHLEFEAFYVDYEGVAFPIQVALPVGLPFLGDGLGELVTVCDGSLVYAALPDFPDREGHDHYDLCIGCVWEDPDVYDGWYTRVLSAVPRLAAPDSTTATALDEDWSFCAMDLLRAAGLAADRFAADYEPESIPADDAAIATDAGTQPASSAASALAPAAVAASAGFLALVGLIASVAVALRKLR